MSKAWPVLLLFAASCSGASEPEAPPAPTPAAPSAELALPVTAPMQARERLLRDLDTQRAQQRQRNAELERIMNPR